MYFNKIVAMSAAVSIFLITIFTANGFCAERYDDEKCFKEHVSNKGEDLVIAVNRDSGQVELYWSDVNREWRAPSREEQPNLQRLYNKKIQLREMQDGLDRMHDDTWYTTDQDIGTHR